jgi:hypothetical protein
MKPGDPTRVRLADASDEEEIFSMFKLMHGENGLFEMSEHKVRTLLQGALRGGPEERKGLIGTIGDHGALKSFIFLEIGSLYYTEDICLIEQWNFVLPPHRGTSASQDQIAFAADLSDRYKMPLLIGVLSTDRTAAKVRHYRRQLGDPIGVYFGRNLTPIRGTV